MAAELAVLLRDKDNSGATTRLALKVDQLSLAYSRTPIHIAIPFSEPQIFDLGTTRPTMTLSGVIDNIGMDTTNTTANAFFNMEKFTTQGQTYYIPYKNYLEFKLITWTTDESTQLQIEIGDATTPDYSGSGTTASTGGGVYEVAVQQFQFTQTPGTEDRWQYSIQFVTKFRDGIAFPT
jgi:hypothetical protein